MWSLPTICRSVFRTGNQSFSTFRILAYARVGSRGVSNDEWVSPSWILMRSKAVRRSNDICLSLYVLYPGFMCMVYVHGWHLHVSLACTLPYLVYKSMCAQHCTTPSHRKETCPLDVTWTLCGRRSGNSCNSWWLHQGFQRIVQRIFFNHVSLIHHILRLIHWIGFLRGNDGFSGFLSGNDGFSPIKLIGP